ncbi:uncharacterized protein [Periplaneta americana]|uniref:uncharacterized protein n=1 Tax=Periplaneta americana TaxID=6978 RepID=UPI0037E937E8
MTRACLFICLLLLVLFNVIYCAKTIARPVPVCNRGHYWRQLQSSPESMAAINFMCDSTSLDNIESGNPQFSSDACFGCFSRVIHQAQNEMFLKDLSSCATTYLQNTPYQQCADELLYSANGNSTEELPVPLSCQAQNNIFCNFEKCIHHNDKISLIQSCIDEVQSSAGNDTGVEMSQVDMYINTTACILSKIRCRNNMNTGRMQTHTWYPHQVNAVYITAENDIRVTNIPLSQMAMMCGYNSNNVGQATWKGLKC